MTFSITLAKQTDLKDIYEIMTSCTKWLSAKGLNYWEGVYSFKKLK